MSFLASVALAGAGKVAGRATVVLDGQRVALNPTEATAPPSRGRETQADGRARDAEATRRREG